MKMSSLVFLVLLVSGFNCHADSGLPSRREMVDFLEKYCRYRDSNPIWQDEAEEVNEFVRRAINWRRRPYDADMAAEALDIFYRNSISVFEDATDIKRYEERRFLCFLALALISDDYRFGAFLNDAANCVTNGYGELEYKKYLVDISHLLILYDFGLDSFESSVDKLREELASPPVEMYIPEEFLKDCLKLIAE